MTASSQVEHLRALLREQGLGSALPEVAGKVHPRASTGSAEWDALLGGGLPRGKITEIRGKNSAGCTSAVFALLAASTGRGEIAAYIDVTDSLDPPSARQAGIELNRLLWVRCGGPRVHVYRRIEPLDPPPEEMSPPGGGAAADRAFPGAGSASESRSASGKVRGRRRRTLADQAWEATNLVAAAGGFGVIALDLCGLSLPQLRHWQGRQWLRPLRAVEGRETVLVVATPQPLLASAAAATLDV